MNNSYGNVRKSGGFAKFIIIVLIVYFVYIFLLGFIKNPSGTSIFKSKDFTILSNADNKDYMDELIKYGKKEGIKIDVVYADDLEAIDMLEDTNNFDAVWMSNSIWLYMLENAKVTNSKSIYINPIVMGVKKSKATELNLIRDDLKNSDIVKAIGDKKLNYVMSSVTKTNTGMTSYLGFLNALSGSPEILTSSMLKNRKLVNNLKSLFSGVERVSGSDTFLEDMFLKDSSYEAVIASESSLIRINKFLENSNREPLYLLYPVDGVAINDSPFAYVDRKQNKIDKFLKLQEFLLSDASQKSMESLGKRTWYGGVNSNANKQVFRSEWGINTNNYLIPLKYPSKKVMNEAIALYIDELRKPSATAFCLDYSGSMYGTGKSQLSSAMSYILNSEEASKDLLQFSKNDKIYVIPFDSKNRNTWYTDNGINTSALINNITNEKANGGTNIYNCVDQALKVLENVDKSYNKTVILMTDGDSVTSTYDNLALYYSSNNLKTPVYSIMFGSAKEEQLLKLANLTNAKVFDGRTNLKSAFKEVRSYN